MTGMCPAAETIVAEAAHAVAVVTGTEPETVTGIEIVTGTRIGSGNVTVVTGNGRGTETEIVIGIETETGVPAGEIEAPPLDGSGATEVAVVEGAGVEPEAVVRKTTMPG